MGLSTITLGSSEGGLSYKQQLELDIYGSHYEKQTLNGPSNRREMPLNNTPSVTRPPASPEMITQPSPLPPSSPPQLSLTCASLPIIQPKMDDPRLMSNLTVKIGVIEWVKRPRFFKKGRQDSTHGDYFIEKSQGLE